MLSTLLILEVLNVRTSGRKLSKSPKDSPYSYAQWTDTRLFSVFVLYSENGNSFERLIYHGYALINKP